MYDLFSLKGLDVVDEIQHLLPPSASSLSSSDLRRFLTDGYTTRRFRLHGRFQTFTHEKPIDLENYTCASLLNEKIPSGSKDPFYKGDAYGFLAGQNNTYYTRHSSASLTIFTDDVDIRFIYVRPPAWSIPNLLTDSRYNILYVDDIGGHDSSLQANGTTNKPLERPGSYLEPGTKAHDLIDVIKHLALEPSTKLETTLAISRIEALFLWLADDQAKAKNEANDVLEAALKRASYGSWPASNDSERLGKLGEDEKIEEPRRVYWTFELNYLLAGMCIERRSYAKAITYYSQMIQQYSSDVFRATYLASDKHHLRHRVRSHALQGFSNLAMIFLKVARIEAAIDLLRRLVAEETFLLGNEHKETLKTLETVSIILTAKLTSNAVWPFPIVRQEYQTGFETIAYPDEEAKFNLRSLTANLLENKHAAALNMLAASRIDPNSKNAWGRRPIHHIAQNGDRAIEILSLLLNRGAEVNAQDLRGVTPLFLAAEGSHKRLIKELLLSGADVNLRTKFGRSPLHQVVEFGHEEIVQLLLECGADLGLPDVNQYTPLHLAATEGHLSITAALLTRGADPSARTIEGYTPVYLAARSAHYSSLRLLVDSGAPADIPDQEGRTALHAAAASGNSKTVQLLLDQGISVDAQDHNGTEPLHFAASNGHDEIVRLLLDKKVDPNAKNCHGMTALHVAAESGHTSVAKTLLDYGAEPDFFGAEYTPLQLAASHGNADTFQLLLQAGARVDACASNGRTALHLAVFANSIEIVHQLLSVGANIDHRDEQHLTPLLMACDIGNLDIAQVLVEAGAEIDAKGVDGTTPLWFAAQNGHWPVVQLLIGYGASLDAYAHDIGRCALHQAAQNGHFTVVRLLIDSGAVVNVEDLERVVPLWLASQNGHKDIVLFLLRAGADPNVRSAISGRTALHQAAQNGHLEVLETLLDHGADATILDNQQRSCLSIMIHQNRRQVSYMLTMPNVWIRSQWREAIVNTLAFIPADPALEDFEVLGRVYNESVLQGASRVIINLLLERYDHRYFEAAGEDRSKSFDSPRSENGLAIRFPDTDTF